MAVSIGKCFLFLSVLSSSFSLTESLRHDDINWSDMKDKADWVSNLLVTNKELVRQAPEITKFIKSVAADARLLAVNPAFTATTIYFTAVLVASYYYSLEAEQQLMKAQFKHDDLRLIIETEIAPNFKLLEKMLSRGNLEGFCKVKDSYKNQLGETVSSLGIIRKEIGEKMVESSSGATKNKILQLLTGAGGIGLGVMVAAAPCVGTAFLACPQAIAGTVGVATSVAGFLGFRSNQLTHEETLALLKATRITAYEAERACRMARTTIETTCAEFAVSEEMVDINNMMKSLEIFMPKKETLQLEHSHDDKERKAKYVQIN